MAWTYSGDPSSSDRDNVRFLVQDTISTDELLQDEEIDHVLTLTPGDPRRAAAECALVISRKFARLADTAAPELKVSFSKRAETYRALADDLTRDVGLGDEGPPIAAPSVLGITCSEKEVLAEDDDLVQPAFGRGMHDYPSSKE